MVCHLLIVRVRPLVAFQLQNGKCVSISPVSNFMCENDEKDTQAVGLQVSANALHLHEPLQLKPTQTRLANTIQTINGNQNTSGAKILVPC